MKTLKNIFLSTLLAAGISTGCTTMPTPVPSGAIKATKTKSTTHSEYGRIDCQEYPIGLKIIYTSTPGTPNHTRQYYDFEGDKKVDTVIYAKQKTIDGHLIEANTEIERNYWNEKIPALFKQVDEEYKELLNILRE